MVAGECQCTSQPKKEVYQTKAFPEVCGKYRIRQYNVMRMLGHNKGHYLRGGVRTIFRSETQYNVLSCTCVHHDM